MIKYYKIEDYDYYDGFYASGETEITQKEFNDFCKTHAECAESDDIGGIIFNFDIEKVRLSKRPVNIQKCSFREI